jgi:hypothetical protein
MELPKSVFGVYLELFECYIRLHQVITESDSEEHLAAMGRAEEELNGLATTIANELDLRM